MTITLSGFYFLCNLSQNTTKLQVHKEKQHF